TGVGRWVQAGSAELLDPDLERDPGSGRGLLEDHSERPPGEEVVLLSRLQQALELVGQVEHLEELLPAPVGDPGEGAALEAVRDRDHWSAAILLASKESLPLPDGNGESRPDGRDRKSTRLNSSHGSISYAVFCLKKKTEDRSSRPWRPRIRTIAPRVACPWRVRWTACCERPGTERLARAARCRARRTGSARPTWR